MQPTSRRARTLLRLQLTRGVGPAIGRRLIESFGDGDAVFRASQTDLRRVEGIGEKKAAEIRVGLGESEERALREIERVQALGAHHIAIGDEEYPALLAETPDAPLVLSVRGSLEGIRSGHTIAVVGSRRCTPYGIEQTERFAGVLAQSGIGVISGGARGIDSAAHRSSLRVKGCTVAVLGCGLAHTYPPENRELFDEIVEHGGAIVSELPVDTAPVSENFPARNRIISGLSLGVLVIEAPKGSGALITARHAIDEHGREVFAVPGRVDSAASGGANQLIQRGEAMLVSAPGDIIEGLARQAEHLRNGTRASVYSPRPGMLFEPGGARGSAEPRSVDPSGSLSDSQRALWEALGASEAGIDELARSTGIGADRLLADLTVMEVRRLIVRRGGRFSRAR